MVNTYWEVFQYSWSPDQRLHRHICHHQIGGSDDFETWFRKVLRTDFRNRMRFLFVNRIPVESQSNVSICGNKILINILVMTSMVFLITKVCGPVMFSGHIDCSWRSAIEPLKFKISGSSRAKSIIFDRHVHWRMRVGSKRSRFIKPAGSFLPVILLTGRSVMTYGVRWPALSLNVEPCDFIWLKQVVTLLTPSIGYWSFSTQPLLKY